ncbi:hypothetical protein BDY21DRAFT_366195 [Lineolata rhizophorae]|uniref:Uncharacterized protein n=1 Tax=Lineolata rhizophorae TaxID=578093 RepID=A0A6A6NRQ0_9PEZI|nr:hypothetical protein BDY21DRAFT_366195 [Lineolata rhizophorae]
MRELDRPIAQVGRSHATATAAVERAVPPSHRGRKPGVPCDYGGSPDRKKAGLGGAGHEFSMIPLGRGGSRQTCEPANAVCTRKSRRKSVQMQGPRERANAIDQIGGLEIRKEPRRKRRFQAEEQVLGWEERSLGWRGRKAEERAEPVRDLPLSAAATSSSRARTVRSFPPPPLSLSRHGHPFTPTLLTHGGCPPHSVLHALRSYAFWHLPASLPPYPALFDASVRDADAAARARSQPRHGTVTGPQTTRPKSPPLQCPRRF